jgi:plastocyanin
MRGRSEEARPQGMAIRIANFTFSPQTLNSTVTWVNKDGIPHAIASNDSLFKSKVLETDQEYSHTFTEAGTYPYHCSIHPKMVGQIVVK